MPSGPVAGSDVESVLFDFVDAYDRAYESAAGSQDLSVAQACVLGRITEQRAMGGLAAELGCDASNVTQVVSRLEARGLVAREADPADRRVKRVARTAAGDDVYQRFERAFGFARQATGKLDGEERDQLATLLRKAHEPLVEALRGERVVLVPLVEEHAEALREIRRHQDVADWWGTLDDEFPWEEPEAERFTVLLDGRVAGMIEAHEENEPDYRNVEVDIFLDADLRGQGIGPDVLHTLIRHLVEDRGHHRVFLGANVHNARAIRAYEKAGFRTVGHDAPERARLPDREVRGRGADGVRGRGAGGGGLADRLAVRRQPHLDVPRVAFEYGHTLCAFSTSSAACAASSMLGSVTSSATDRPKPPSEVGLSSTLESTDTSSASTFNRRATVCMADSKHDA